MLAVAATNPNFDLFIRFLGDNLFWVVVGVVAVVAIVFGTITSAIHVRTRERTRREIAAYVAEGSMTPEQGRDLLEAGRDDD